VSPFIDVSAIASLDEVCSGEMFAECVELTSRSQLLVAMEGAVAEKVQWVVAAGAMQCWMGEGGFLEAGRALKFVPFLELTEMAWVSARLPQTSESEKAVALPPSR
jgi:hypothetical protein